MNYQDFKRCVGDTNIINRFKIIRNKIIRCKVTITFLIKCRNQGIMPQFIRNSTKNIFKIFDEYSSPSVNNQVGKYIRNLQNKILNSSIKQKHYLLKSSEDELKYLTYTLSRFLGNDKLNNFLKYEEIIGEKLMEKEKQIHKKKFDNCVSLQMRELGIKFNRKWFVNKTGVDIPEDVQWILSLGQKHALPVNREEFPILKVISEGEDFIETKEKKEEQEIARSNFVTVIDNHLNKMTLNNRDIFTIDKVKNSQNFLKHNREIMILKADKGNTTVAINKRDYISRIHNILSDNTTFHILDKDPTSRFQKMNNNFIEELFKLNIITSVEKVRLKTSVAVVPRLYGLPKIHKENFPLRPICSSINSPSHKLCKYIVNILGKLTENSKYNVSNSVQFKDKMKGILIQNNEKLISLDVVSLFPSIPVDLAIRIIEENWNKISEWTNINKNLFMRIIKFCIVDNRYFQYDGKIYAQQKGLPMGSPASPIIADIVMEKLLDTCLEKLRVKPKIITKYVDDLFCIVEENEIDILLTTLNSFDQSIKFTIEKELNSSISYLDTLVIREGNKLLIDWYQKPTSSGRIINYFSKHPKRIIINTAKNLIDRILRISDNRFHKKNKEIIRNILKDNSFPNKLICKLIRQYNIKKSENVGEILEPKVYKSLTYVPGFSERIENSNIYDKGKYKLAHKINNNVGRLFTKTKDRLKKSEMSNLVYKIPCGGNDIEQCEKVYVGTTGTKLKTRIAGHRHDQKYRNYNSTTKTALSTHCRDLNHYPDFENTFILNTENYKKRRYMLEMLQINNVPFEKRINFKMDTDNLAQNYRCLLNKNKYVNNSRN